MRGLLKGKRTGIKVILLMLLVAVFSAMTAAKEPVTLNFWFPSESEINNKYFLESGNEYSKTHPNVTVKVTAVPGGSGDINIKLNAARLSGTSPDVVSVFLALIPMRGSRGAYEPLSKYINRWRDRSDMFESALNIGKYKNDILGLGFYPAPSMLVYRKDFFREAGLDPEKPPKTWEELANYAMKLTVKDNNGNTIRAGFDIPFYGGTLYETMVRQNGGLFIDERNQVPMLDEPAAIETFQFLADLYKKGVSIPFDATKADEVPFISGKSAMSNISTGQLKGMLTNDPGMREKIGIVPVLARKKKSAFCGFRLFTISADSKHKDEAWKFIEFMMSKDQMWKRAQGLKIPVVRKSLMTNYIKDDPMLNTAIMDYVQNGKGAYIIPWMSIYANYAELAWQECITGKKTAEQALKDAQKALIKELEKIV